ncbi:outer membrane transport energization protein TonB [Pseudoxanthomonas sp. GM95]|uniref:energy transducer TonB n=1 Tax=Pseudoxanthomonas sp. GM95 TaxID=1881043 RepID=UPI0008D6DE29|nr:energy transducer TonB [Pseudoxanthomonas sp. GM95]SEL90723.1 outer membrane transport energization protein TonB [Pseudoxanthomonas sp. GM95]
MSRSQTEINADLQHDAKTQQDKPTSPLLWLLLIAAVLVAGVWWFGSNRESQAPMTADTTTSTQAEADAAASAQASKPAKAVTARKETASRKPVVADRAPSLMAGMAQPKYPPSALRAGAAGTVTLDVQVDPQGEPSQISIAQRSGNRDLDRAALKAASDWRFEPAMRNGKAVAAAVKVPVEFSVQ